MLDGVSKHVAFLVVDRGGRDQPALEARAEPDPQRFQFRQFGHEAKIRRPALTTGRRWEIQEHVAVTDAARKLLAQRGCDPVYGARPLKRTIQRLVQDPLAVMLLEGKFSDGDTVEVDVQNDQLTFSKTKAAATVG
jgi:hypothetical protein